MKRSVVIVGLVLMGLVLASGCAAQPKCAKCPGKCGNPAKCAGAETRKVPQYAHYGQPMKLSQKHSIPVKEVLADPTEYADKYIRVAGTVDQVCARRGCWIRLADASAGDSLFVKFTCPVTGRLIPAEAVGHQAMVEGTLDITEITEEQARHIAEEAKASADEIARIVGPQKQVMMKSPGALIEK